MKNTILTITFVSILAPLSVNAQEGGYINTSKGPYSITYVVVNNLLTNDNI